MKIFSILLNIILILVLALIIVIPFAKSSLLFQPNRKIDKFPSDYGIPFMEVTILTKDDIKLSAWNIPSKYHINNENMNQENDNIPDFNNDIILFCHGNAGNISSRKSLITIFHKLGYSTFIFDYRGYGRSTGTASVDGFYKDIETVWDYLTKIRGVNEKNIILFGESIGVSVACYIAQKHNPKCLILQSGFASLCHILEDYLPSSTPRVILQFIDKFIVGNDFNTLKYVRSITAPKLILHSLSDDIIPFYHSQLLYDNSLEPKEFYEIKGTHNEFKIDKLYIEEIDEFITISNMMLTNAINVDYNIPEIEYFNEEKINNKITKFISENIDDYSPNAQLNNDDTDDETNDDTDVIGYNNIALTDDDELSSDDEERLREIVDGLDSEESEESEDFDDDE